MYIRPVMVSVAVPAYRKFSCQPNMLGYTIFHNYFQIHKQVEDHGVRRALIKVLMPLHGRSSLILCTYGQEWHYKLESQQFMH